MIADGIVAVTRADLKFSVDSENRTFEDVDIRDLLACGSSFIVCISPARATEEKYCVPVGWGGGVTPHAASTVLQMMAAGHQDCSPIEIAYKWP